MQSLRRRARRLARQGELRKAAGLLRTLVALRSEPSHWVLLGDMLRRAHRIDEAREAFKQGLWLNRQAGAHARAATVATLIATLG
ncbi:MAG: hypothetical protein HY908_17010 [Myxococcales bacterium]|nr:hypothetical protein [Myxococcales bacterium]